MHPVRVAIISIVAMVITFAAPLVGGMDCIADEAARVEEAVTGHASARAVARYARPTTGPTQVEIAVVVLDVERIDDAIQGFSANVLILARWSDTRLAHDGTGDEWLSLDAVWHPRLQVANLRQASATLPEIVEVTPDGTVTYRQRLLGEFSQKFDLSDFPLDRQTLAIQIVSLGNLQDEVVFAAHPGIPSGIVPEVSISDWEILGSRASTQPYQPMPGVQPRAGYVLEFDAKRFTLYYRTKIILPLLLIVAMSWLVFWIDPELAGPQISIAVTSVLTLIAYRFMVSGMLPKISYLTRMDWFTSASTMLVFLTLVEATYTVMLTKHGRLERAQTIDRISRWGVPLAFVLVFAWAFLI